MTSIISSILGYAFFVLAAVALASTIMYEWRKFRGYFDYSGDYDAEIDHLRFTQWVWAFAALCLLVGLLTFESKCLAYAYA